ncbi:MAG: CopG family transcriptional regulator [Dehalococcoidia bacterium]
MSLSLKRTTIFLTEDQLERLRQLAFIRRTSMSHLIREAAMEVLEDEEDIREGLRALADAKGTVSWKDYQQKRKERKLKG